MLFSPEAPLPFRGLQCLFDWICLIQQACMSRVLPACEYLNMTCSRSLQSNPFFSSSPTSGICAFDGMARCTPCSSASVATGFARLWLGATVAVAGLQATSAARFTADAAATIGADGTIALEPAGRAAPTASAGARPIVRSAASPKQESPGAVDCQWAAWDPWTPCTKSCGSGSSSRVRSEAVHASRGGQPCEGSREEAGACNVQGCPAELPILLATPVPGHGSAQISAAAERPGVEQRSGELGHWCRGGPCPRPARAAISTASLAAGAAGGGGVTQLAPMALAAQDPPPLDPSGAQDPPPWDADWLDVADVGKVAATRLLPEDLADPTVATINASTALVNATSALFNATGARAENHVGRPAVYASPQSSNMKGGPNYP